MAFPAIPNFKTPQMSKRKQIENISTLDARSIILRFMPAYWSKDHSEKHMRTVARDLCRRMKKTPKELIATPIPRK